MNDSSITTRLCEILVSAAEIIRIQNEIIAQLGGDKIDPGVLGEIEEYVGNNRESLFGAAPGFPWRRE